MTMRGLQKVTTRAIELQAKHQSRTSVRFFATELSKEEQAAKLAKEDALHEELRKQVIEKQNRTILPYHATDAVSPSVNAAPIPYPEECAIVSGVEKWASGRKVNLFMPARHQMQSGVYNTRHWELRFDSPCTWENPLMGWTSTAEPFHGMVMKFDKKEDALSFAKRQNWEVTIDEPKESEDFNGKISYSHNFLPLHIENLIKRDGKKSSVQFKHPTGRRSNWVKTLKYHGNGTVPQHGGEAKK